MEMTNIVTGVQLYYVSMYALTNMPRFVSEEEAKAKTTWEFLPPHEKAKWNECADALMTFIGLEDVRDALKAFLAGAELIMEKRGIVQPFLSIVVKNHSVLERMKVLNEEKEDKS